MRYIIASSDSPTYTLFTRVAKRAHLLIFSAAVLMFVTMVSAQTAFSATFTVNSTADVNDATPGNGVCETATGNGVCTLRAAITEANALAGDDNINLPAGTFTTTIPTTNEDANANGDFDITSNITISGMGTINTSVQAAATQGTATDRVFHIVSGTVLIRDLDIRNGRLTSTTDASASRGGGIQNLGTLTLRNVTVINNQTANRAGGIHSLNGTLTLDGVTVSSNSVASTGSTASGAFIAGGGIFMQDSNVTINNSTITNNILNGTVGTNISAFGDGFYFLDNAGGHTATITNTTVSNNTSTGSGTGEVDGIGLRFLTNAGTTTINISNTTISNNSGTSGTGSNQGGGGIAIFPNASGVTVNSTLNNVTVNGNTSDNGGGIYLINASGSIGSTTINNSTISGNFGRANGGGIYQTSPITLNINNSTIAGNTANSDNSGTESGGGIFVNGGTVNIKNSIVGNNSVGTGGSAPDISGAVVSADYNLIQDTTGATINGTTTNNITGVSPNLAALAQNGGMTQTHALNTGSPAINAGDPTNCNNISGSPVTLDQRGLPRSQGGARCDIGAFERGGKTWDGGGGDNNFNTATNWDGDVAPTSSDYVIFNSTNGSISNVNAPTTVLGVIYGGGYSGALILNANLTVNDNLQMSSGNINVTGSNALIIETTGSVTRNLGLVSGNVQKNFASTGSFTYPVGTTSNGNEYSPLTANITALGTNPSSLTVKANYGTVSPVVDANSLDRYWTLTESGDLTATLTFNYLQSDVDGNEANYRIIRVSSGTARSFPNQCPSASCVDTANNTATISGVSNFSDWTLGEVVAPTSAPAVISGRVTKADGAPVPGVTMTLSGTNSVKAITDADGYYSFEGLEAGGFYTVTPQLANYTFGPTSRSLSLTGNLVDATFIATPDSTQTQNPLDTSAYFVRQQYLDFLGREPDQGGLAYWTDRINECGTDASCIRQRRIDVSAAYFMSDEFQQTGSFVYRLYKASFGRMPSYSEFSSDRSRVQVGANLEASRNALTDDFISRTAFRQMYPDSLSNAEFINRLLDTSGISTDRQQLINQLDSGSTRSEVLRAVMEDAGFKTREYNASFVLMQYFGYLRRDADAGGFSFWLDVLNNRVPGNYRSMVCAFLTSAEYQRRFSSLVTRSNSECGQ